MKRVLLVCFSLSLGVPLSACLNTRPCLTDSECAPTGRCDVERQFCVFDPPDSGNGETGGGGGGMTGGGGGTIDAGSDDAGRLDAGVDDGGLPDAGSVDAGADDAGLTDAGDLDAGTFDAGTFDAGTFDAGTFDAGTFDAGTFDAGTFDAGTFDAGTFDAGFDAGSPFCSQACAHPFECKESLDGGRCVSAYILTFEQPLPSQIFGAAAAAMDFTVSVRRTDGGFAGFTSLPFSVPFVSPAAPTQLTQSTQLDLYRATAQLPAVTQTFQAFAGWDGGPFATVNFYVDRTTPNILVQVAPGADGGANLRDALVPMVIHSNKQLDAGALVVTLAGTDGGLTNQSNLIACSACIGRGLSCSGFDLCVQLDLSVPPLAGLSANFVSAVTVTDTAGNTATTNGVVPVTRMRWRAAVPSPATVVRAAPALDKQGNLFVGTQDTVGTGRLVSFTPTGALRFTVAVGGVQSVAVAETNVNGSVHEISYVNVRKGDGSALVVTKTDGTPVVYSSSQPTACDDPARQSFSAISLFDAGVDANGLSEVAAVMVFNPSAVFALDNGLLCRFGPRSGASTATDNEAIQVEPDGNTVLSPANIVVLGNKAYVQRTDKTIGYIDLNPFSAGGSSAGYAAAGLPTGLAIGSGALVATWGGGSSQPISTYQLPSAPSAIVNSNPDVWATARPATLLSNAVITSTNRLGVNWLLSLSQNGTTLGATSAVADPVSAADSGGTSVVAGTGSRLYAVRRDGSLFVYSGQTNNGIGGQSSQWSGALFTTGVDVVAHPTLDCNRTGSGSGRPGTLYVVSTSGLVSAVIVDSTKLDPNAPWPKWQRTAGNAGNPDFALNPGCP